MIKNKRQNEILSILRKRNYASTTYLAAATYASLPTIRRDLICLETQGYISRSHGGAMILQDVSNVSPFDYRRASNRQQKQLLCDYAAKYLKDYQTIFLDESTTVMYLIAHMRTLKNLTVITNGLYAANALSETDIEFYCTGGKFIHNNCFVGRAAEDFIDRFNADVCFFSSTGISQSGNITDIGEYEASVVQAMLRRSAKKYYLCDKSKIGKTAKYNIATANDINKIITTAAEGSLNIPSEKVVYLSENEKDPNENRSNKLIY